MKLFLVMSAINKVNVNINLIHNLAEAFHVLRKIVVNTPKGFPLVLIDQSKGLMLTRQHIKHCSVNFIPHQLTFA